MFEINRNIKIEKQYLGIPTYLIDGDPKSGNRRIAVTIPVLDESGTRISAVYKEYSGDDFADVWSSFDTDESIMSRVLSDMDIDADISSIDGDITNETR